MSVYVLTFILVFVLYLLSRSYLELTQNISAVLKTVIITSDTSKYKNNSHTSV